MDAEEFAGFVNRCQALFSTVDRMVQEISWDEKYDAWRRALSPVDAALANEYVDAVVAGRIPAPKYPSDWDLFASDVRVWCQAEVARRRPVGQKKERDWRPDRRQEFRDHLRLRGFGELAAKLDRDDPIPA